MKKINENPRELRQSPKNFCNNLMNYRNMYRQIKRKPSSNTSTKLLLAISRQIPRISIVCVILEELVKINLRKTKSNPMILSNTKEFIGLLRFSKFYEYFDKFFQLLVFDNTSINNGVIRNVLRGISSYTCSRSSI